MTEAVVHLQMWLYYGIHWPVTRIPLRKLFSIIVVIILTYLFKKHFNIFPFSIFLYTDLKATHRPIHSCKKAQLVLRVGPFVF